MTGNFDTLMGIPNLWKDSVEKEAVYSKATVLLGFFCFFALMLLLSICQTIRTNPGSIPEDNEWDMQSDSMIENSSEDESMISESK